MKTVYTLLLGLVFVQNTQSQNTNALKFDGIDDYVNLNSIQNTMYANKNVFTIEFWMKADFNLQTSSIRTTMFAINEPTGENRLLFIMGGPSNQDGKLMIYPDGSWGTGAIYTSSQIIGDGQCHHIAYTYNNGNCKVYIDGSLVDTHSAICPITSDDRYSLGQEYDNLNTSQFYNGELDDFRIWNVEKSQSDIQSAMNTELSGYEPNLIVYYDFNQGIPDGLNSSVNFLNDKTTNNLDGNLTNFQLNYSVSNWIRGLCVGQFVLIEEDEINLNLFPNPSSQNITLTVENLSTNNIEISIIDTFGKKIIYLNEKSLLNSNEFTIDISSLPSGNYIVQIEIDQGTYSRVIQIVN